MNDDLRAFYARERESRRRIRQLDTQFCLWCGAVFIIAILLSVFR